MTQRLLLLCLGGLAGTVACCDLDAETEAVSADDEWREESDAAAGASDVAAEPAAVH